MLSALVGAACYGGMSGAVAKKLLLPGIGKLRPASLAWLQPQVLNIDGTRIRFDSYLPRGAGVCLLQRGLGDSAAALGREAELLRELGCGVLMMDLPGHGGSGPLVTTFGTREARFLHQAIAEFGLTNRIVAAWGRSVGAATVLQIAPSLPNLRCLILDSMFDGPLRAVTRYALGHPRLRMLLPLVPGVLAWLRLSLMLTGPQHSPVRSIREVRVPTLLITGSRDIGMPPKVQRRLASLLRCSQHAVAVVPEAGHLDCFARAPETYRQWLTRHVARTEQSHV
jgi:pimeloyl-ACP methyl ester carboxylesterase